MAVGVFQPLVERGPTILLAGMVALFACSRVLAARIARTDLSIGLRAIAYFIPIAAASIAATLLGRPEIAVGIIFGTSVGAMTTVIGFIALASPVEAGPPRWRRLWPFQLAAALLVFVMGFKGTFNWHDAIALSIEGLLLYSLWNDRCGLEEIEPENGRTGESVSLPVSGSPPLRVNYASRPVPVWTPASVLLFTAEMALIAILLWIGSWSITQGTVRTAANLRGMSTSALAGSIVSLALVMPMTYGTWRRSTGGRGWGLVTTQIGVVLLNLCLLLPALILLPYLAVHVPVITYWAGDSMLWNERLPKLLLFPTPMWRIDNVLLIIVGVLLLPVAIGKWSLGREEGLVLIAGYFFYLTATIASGFEPGISR
ncbi:MAG: sodium:proton exchanger [Phycisphaerales bacterium]|nr:sodium:proton exchanger [Phycisphaerales bacterium]